MSNMKDLLKQKVRTSPNSVHNQLIEPIAEDLTKKVDVNVNVNINVDVSSKKPKFEERFSRATIFVENDLLQVLEKLSERGKGEKTRIVNEALREWMKEKGYI